jgi:hypothetical protein
MRFSFEKCILVKKHYYYYYYYYYVYLLNLKYVLHDTMLPAQHAPYIKPYDLHHLQFGRRGRRGKQLMNVLKEAWDGSVGTATRYGMDVPGIESQWWARFSAPVQTGPWAPHTALGPPTQPPTEWVQCIYRG